MSRATGPEQLVSLKVSTARLDMLKEERSCRCTLSPAVRISLLAAEGAERATCRMQRVPVFVNRKARRADEWT